MLFFWKESEYEIMWQTYIEIMWVLKGKSTIEIEKINEMEWFNLYFLSIIYSIIESWIINSKFKISKVNCEIFDVNEIVNQIYNSDFYKKNLQYSTSNHNQYIEELSTFLYENLLIYYDRFIEKNKDYIPTSIEKSKKIKLIKKWIERAFKKPLDSKAISFVTNLSESFYKYSKFREEKLLKDLVIKFLENIYDK